MSGQALQRVLVRMMYDPILVSDVVAKRARLIDDGLTPTEVKWIHTLDVRAFGVDAYRRARSLQGLIEEYPTSAAWWLRQPGGGERLDGFFSSESFHRGIMRGESLSVGFGAYLMSLPAAATVQGLLAIEHALAMSRRRLPHAAPTESWTLAANLRLVEVPRGVLSIYSHWLQALRAHAAAQGDLLVAAVLDDGCSLELPAQEGGREWILARDGEGLESLGDGFGNLMALAQSGATWDELVAQVQSDGARPEEAQDIVKSLAEAGELIPTSGQ